MTVSGKKKKRKETVTETFLVFLYVVEMRRRDDVSERCKRRNFDVAFRSTTGWDPWPSGARQTSCLLR